MDSAGHNGHHGPLGGLLSPERDVAAIYRRHFGDRRKERRLLSTASFFCTFAAVRAITHAIRAGRGPFRNITPGGRHIHHMTFGITGLITVGYLWLLEIGIDERRRASRLTSVAYGAGAALTLDEFALWLNLEDDYWTKQGRESIDAVVLFGSLLALSVLGRGFVAEVLGHPPVEASADEPAHANGHLPGQAVPGRQGPGAAQGQA